MATLKDIFQVTHPTITHWFDSWERYGLVGLRNKLGQGRKFIFTDADKPLIKAKVQQSPQQLKQVREELKIELNKDFSIKTLNRFLKSLTKPVGIVGEKV